MTSGASPPNAMYYIIFFALNGHRQNNPFLIRTHRAGHIGGVLAREDAEISLSPATPHLPYPPASRKRTRPRPAGVSGFLQSLSPRAGRTRVQSREPPAKLQLSYPPASRGREWNFTIPHSPRAGRTRVQPPSPQIPVPSYRPARNLSHHPPAPEGQHPHNHVKDAYPRVHQPRPPRHDSIRPAHRPPHFLCLDLHISQASANIHLQLLKQAARTKFWLGRLPDQSAQNSLRPQKARQRQSGMHVGLPSLADNIPAPLTDAYPPP